ncbi:SAM-dependent methyltransferase [Catenuloplanes indicus]|nr:SAM-dependent methyltransferase [Catenuloplanes indicus]
MRTPEQVAGYFDGLDLVPPGAVPIPRWRPEPGANPPPMDGRCGLGRKP